MALSPAAIVVGGNAIRAALAAMQLHSGDPGTGGSANRSSAPPLAPAWSTVDSNGGFGLSVPVAFTGCAVNGPITFVSLWSGLNLTTATWYGNFPLSGDLTADSNGDYTVETFNLSGVAG
jgi:hypothetical protein